MSSASSSITLRGPEDLPALGKYLRSERRRAGLALAKDAAPYLGVGVRLLVQLESGTRGKRGVTIGKLLDVLKGLGLELIVQPRPPFVGNTTPTPPSTKDRPTPAHKKIKKKTTRVAPAL
jgi:hypothetical protein